MSVDLNDPDVQAAIKQAVQEATDGLSSKNSELLAEVKKLKKETGIKPEDLDRLEAERDEALKQRDESQKALKQLTKDFEKVTNDHKAETEFTHKLLVKDGLTEAFMKAGVTDQDYIDLLVSKYSTSAKVVVDGDSRKVMFGEKDKDAFISEWAQTEAAKKVIAAPINSGGGAQGGGGGGGVKTMKRSQFEALDAAGKAQFSKDKGVLTDD